VKILIEFNLFMVVSCGGLLKTLRTFGCHKSKKIIYQLSDQQLRNGCCHGIGWSAMQILDYMKI
jgi:hypothetical protein